jgi:hypothetical protein
VKPCGRLTTGKRECFAVKKVIVLPPIQNYWRPQASVVGRADRFRALWVSTLFPERVDSFAEENIIRTSQALRPPI